MPRAKKVKTKLTPELMGYVEKCASNTTIAPDLYIKYDVKRGLRDVDGKGVVAGLTEISEVQGFKLDENGERVQCEGVLFYRGINVRDLIAGCIADDRMGFEETIYLLLFGELPNASELETFKATLTKNRVLPRHFVRDVVMKAPGKDMMNLLARSVLTLYSYDELADDTSIPNVLSQSLRLISILPMLGISSILKPVAIIVIFKDSSRSSS